jgi:L-ascorbate metabolism protein UlaG (beta-lactamase superfamily)
MWDSKRFILIFLAVLSVLGLGGMYLSCRFTPPAPSIPPTPSAPSSTSPQTPGTPVSLTTIQFLGQACFVITSQAGLKIVTDPYTPTNTLAYSPVDVTDDIITVSHEHADHNNVAGVKGQPEVIRGTGVKNIKGIEFKGIPTWHDASNGTQRGQNTVFIFSIDGMKFCHLGDLGHRLSPEQISQIGNLDILLIPVGGNYTIDAKMATEVMNDLNAKITIPMHYKTPKANLPISGVEDFLQGKENVKKLNSSIYQFMPGDLPDKIQIVVLEPAR